LQNRDPNKKQPEQSRRFARFHHSAINTHNCKGTYCKDKSNLVSIEAEMNDKLIDMMESMGAEHVQEKIDIPVLIRCCSGMDQISDVVLSCGSLEEAPASVSVQVVKSFRLIHRVCKGDV
jgi:hypothetical protein